MNDPVAVWQTLQRVRERGPLVHNITNFVAMALQANALLAVGASPVMAHAIEEVGEFVDLADALAINIGTLAPDTAEAMRRAARRAQATRTPWVLDPVGVGATRFRLDVCRELLDLAPLVLRGNASEILALSGPGASGKGVDSAHSTEAAISSAQRLARRFRCTVAVTGVVDYVTDGDFTLAIANGHEMMARITGLGCATSSLVAAFCAVNPDPLAASAHALAVMGVCGEVAASQAAGPGSLQPALLDALYGLNQETLQRRVRMNRLP